jgi:hypothetical protein
MTGLYSTASSPPWSHANCIRLSVRPAKFRVSPVWSTGSRSTWSDHTSPGSVSNTSFTSRRSCVPDPGGGSTLNTVASAIASASSSGSSPQPVVVETDRTTAAKSAATQQNRRTRGVIWGVLTNGWQPLMWRSRSPHPCHAEPTAKHLLLGAYTTIRALACGATDGGGPRTRDASSPSAPQHDILAGTPGRGATNTPRAHPVIWRPLTARLAARGSAAGPPARRER